MRILTAGQMKIAERMAVENGTSYERLMENAGCGAAERILQCFFQTDGEQLPGNNVLVLLGKGNNGGDGLVIARKLLEAVPELRVTLLFGLGRKLSELAALNLERLMPFHERVRMLDEEDIKDQGLDSLCHESCLIIDGIFGTGFSGQLPEKIARLLRVANGSKAVRIALDIPSGMDCNNGIFDADTFRAHITYTFAAMKPVHLLKRSRGLCGDIQTVEIGITEQMMEQIPGSITYLDAQTVRKALPSRQEDSNKGSYGKLLNVGGCASMSGAVLLSSMSAYRCGVGLVMTAAPETALTAVRMQLPEAIHCVLPLGETGAISPENGEMLVQKVNRWSSAALIGCGMSVTEESKAVIRQLLTETEKPTVIDADGLNCIAAMGEEGMRLLDDAKVPLILTPHMLEFSRLSGMSIDEIKADRFAIAWDFATKHHLTLVLKDSNTVIASPDGELYMNDNGNSGLSKGGSGDVLAGMVASFLAQGAEPVQAAVCGVYLHAAAGDAAERHLTAYGMLPSDVIECIPEAFGELLWM